MDKEKLKILEGLKEQIIFYETEKFEMIEDLNAVNEILDSLYRELNSL